MKGVRGVMSLSLMLVVMGVHAAEVNLDDALRLAKQRNGTIQSAMHSVAASRSDLRGSMSSFFPTLTPEFTWGSSQNDVHTGSLSGTSRTTGDTFNVGASYKIWDSGSRRFSVDSARYALNATEASALQSVRSTLFGVSQQYYDVQRAQELLKVAKSQQDRAEIILKQTQARIDVGDLPGKDIYQPKADRMNAEVAVLTAQNRVSTSIATLKALIGWREQDGSMEVASIGNVGDMALPSMTFEEAIDTGRTKRPDLQARRFQVNGQEIGVSIAKLNAGITYSIDANYNRSFSRDVSDRTSVGLVASIPLFDGGRTKADVRSRQESLEGSRSQLEQAERDVEAEIESAYKAYVQNLSVLAASRAALDAAQKNYEFVLAAHKEQVATQPELTIAESTLVTAQVNFVQAEFDALISQDRLNLVVGLPVRGE